MFCELEPDQKTFEYIQYYLHYYQDNQDCDFLLLDKEIQMNELQWHLDSRHLSNYEAKTKEALDWIRENAKPFRSYLNTIKMVFVVWHCMGNEWKDITWEEFCKIRNRMNDIKNVCLDTIFVEHVHTENVSLIR